jgi:hypothetical protein
MFSKKKATLFLLIALEIVLGLLFLRIYYVNKFNSSVLGVSGIDKDSVIFTPEEELDSNDLFEDFKHYYVYRPNTSSYKEPEWLEYEAEYKFNSDGLKEIKDYPITKDPGVIRIATIGDSFTFGFYINTPDTWPKVLEKRLQESTNQCDFEVINFGAGGFDIPYLVKRYEDIGKKYDSDFLLWFESVTGFTRLTEEIMEYNTTCKSESDDLDKLYDCWFKAQDMIHEKYTNDELRNYIQRYLDYFFQEVVLDEKIIFFMTENNLSDDNRNSLDIWREEYAGLAVFDSGFGGLSQDQLLPDGHPSNIGHEVIAEYALSLIENDPKTEYCF